MDKNSTSVLYSMSTACLQCIVVIFLITAYSDHWLVCGSRCLLVQVWPLGLDPGRKYWTLQEVCFVKIKTCSQPQVNRPLHNKCMRSHKFKHTLLFDVANFAHQNHRDKDQRILYPQCLKLSAASTDSFYSFLTCWPFQRCIWEWGGKMNGGSIEEYISNIWGIFIFDL